jgi:ABC-type multidrug transport system permease subunit
MRQVLRLALNDLRLTVKDRMAFFWMLLLPIGFMWFFGFMVRGGGGEAPQIALGLVDRDEGWLARALVEELDDEAVDLTLLEPDWKPFVPDTEQPARWIVLPQGLTEGALAGEQQTVRLVRHPDASEEYSTAAEAHLIRAIARVLGRLVELGTAEGGLEGLAGAAEAPEGFAALGERPALVALEVSTAGRGRPVPAGYAQSVPGILTMTVLMMTLIHGGTFLTVEKMEGMIRRQATAPLSRAQIFAGKLTGRLLMALAQTAVLIAAGRFLFGVDWGHSPGGLLLVLVCYAAAVAGLATLLGALLRTPEQAGSLGWILAMALAALGGCWWPSEVVPSWIRSASHLLPTAWAMDAFHALISYGRGIEGVLMPSAVLLGFALLFSAVGARYLRYD